MTVTGHAAWQDWAKRWGWRESTATPCPLPVAGRRCRSWTGDCVCQRYYSLLDHRRLWLDEKRRYIFSAEPYHAEGEDFAEFNAEMRRLGLHVWLTGDAVWHPDAMLMLVRRESAS